MRTLLSVLALLLALPAAALDLLPTTLQLPAEGGPTELWVYNPGPGRWQGQVRVLQWEQHADAEMLRPGDRIVASPTRLDLAAGVRQRIWLLPRQPTPVVAEQAYRIVLAPTAPGLPRYSLPLFRAQVAPAATPRLHARIESDASHSILRLHNTGTLHARLHDLSYVARDGRRTLLLPGLAGYLLAGGDRRWPLPGPPGTYSGGHFLARLQDGQERILDASTPTIAAGASGGL